MAETHKIIQSKKLAEINLFICVKGVDLLEFDKQFSAQVSSVDDYSLTTSQFNR